MNDLRKEAVLTRRKAKKKTSNFMCRRGSHEFVDVGGFEAKGVSFYFRWCTTCGCLEEAVDGEDKVKIRVPDTGI